MSTRAQLERASGTIAARCACYTVRLASRAITRFYDAVMAPSGLRPTQFVVLVGVYRGFGTTLTALGNALGMDRTTLSRNLRPPVRRGLVTMALATDRRRRTLQTTKRGEWSLARTIPYLRKAQRHVVTSVGPEKWATLSRELRGLAKAIRGRRSRTAIGPDARTGKKRVLTVAASSGQPRHRAWPS